MKYQMHTACAAWPQMTEEEISNLAADIKTNGLLEAITLDPQGLLLDGRNRALACERIGVEPMTVVYAGDPFVFSLSKNASRRHISSTDLAMITASLVTVKRGRPRKEKSSKELFISDAAKAAGIPVAAIKRARVVLDHGTPEEIAAVKSGEAKLAPTVDAIQKRRKNSKENSTTVSTSTPKAKKGPIDKAIEIVKPLVERGAEIHAERLANAHGISRRTINDAVNRERLRLSALDEIGVKTDDLSVTARQKFEVLERKLRIGIETEIEQRARAMAAEIIERRLGYIQEKLQQAELIINKSKSATRQPFTNAEYRLLLAAFHPDANTEHRDKAFLLLKDKEILLRPPEKDWRPSEDVPRTLDELMARKAAVKEARKTKRESARA